MKQLLLISLLSLSGCALIDAYNLKYDVMEYNQITEIRTLAQQSKSKCGDPLSAVGPAISLSTKTLTFAKQPTKPTKPSKPTDKLYFFKQED